MSFVLFYCFFFFFNLERKHIRGATFSNIIVFSPNPGVVPQIKSLFAQSTILFNPNTCVFSQNINDIVIHIDIDIDIDIDNINTDASTVSFAHTCFFYKTICYWLLWISVLNAPPKLAILYLIFIGSKHLNQQKDSTNKICYTHKNLNACK